MVSKLSRQEENEFVLSEKLDLYIYEEIAKYLTIQDIQLIVSSLEAMYQLSELGEETNSKIAEVSNSVGKWILCGIKIQGTCSVMCKASLVQIQFELYISAMHLFICFFVMDFVLKKGGGG